LFRSSANDSTLPKRPILPLRLPPLNVEGAALPDPAGIAVFTRSSRFVEAKISPGGAYLAAIRLEGGKRYRRAQACIAGLQREQSEGARAAHPRQAGQASAH
jgi:hypothetical protein